MSIAMVGDKVFRLNTKAFSYVVYIGPEQLPMNAYWGPLVEHDSDFADAAFAREPLHFPPQHLWPQEYAAFGGLFQKETSIRVCFEDGVGDLRLRFSHHTICDDHLCLTLLDQDRPLTVELWYRVRENENIVERWCCVKSNVAQPVTLINCATAQFSLPGTGYCSTNFTGRWSGEFQQKTTPIDCGKLVYESLYGLTGHQCGPFFAVHQGADETDGMVWFGALAYSGNFKVTVENVCGEHLNIVAGINDSTFQRTLHNGESFETPHLFAGCAKGFGQMSRTLHHFALQKLLPSPMCRSVLPVLYNSWYSTEFAVNEQQQLALARIAAGLGVELFVMDDGWFRGRVDSTAGLGDWTADSVKFPNGLTPLIDGIEALGMRFGLWIEPEMVNPDSELYRAHPDWILRYAGREPIQWRNQYILNISNPAIQEYLFSSLNDLLHEYHISYLKWDMNRYMAEIGSVGTEQEDFALCHAYTEGVYSLARRLRNAHPTVELEACASGGGRVDYGAIQYFDEFWPSDNTDPLDRLLIQQHYSLLYPPKCMRSWITDDTAFNGRQIPLQFAIYTAMCGALGIGVNLALKDSETLSAIGCYIEQYKAIRPIVQLGSCYRLSSFEASPLQAVQYLLENSGVVFVFLHSAQYGKSRYRCLLQGLKPTNLYSCRAGDLCYVKSGSYLMQHGLELILHGDWSSVLVTLEAVEG